MPFVILISKKGVTTINPYRGSNGEHLLKSTHSIEAGIIGMGIMGGNLALNLAGQGFTIAVFDRDTGKLRSFRSKAKGLDIVCSGTMATFVRSLATPRIVLLLVPTGSQNEAVMQELVPLLQPGDVVVDCGNCHFKDTNRRQALFEAKGLHYLGVGISGGEQGARYGSCIMPGGNRDDYERLRPFFEAAAARVDGYPCVAYLGPGSSGHYVKMVHNGIEYALMQMIAESYGILKLGLGMGNNRLQTVFDQWNREELSSYLLEVTAKIFQQTDNRTGIPLPDIMLDRASQRIADKWSSQDAMELQVPVPVIDMAITMRSISTCKHERKSASRILAGPKNLYLGDHDVFINQLKNALYTGMIIAFSQGMAHLHKASSIYGYNFKLSDVARIWRGGSIIRSAVLEEIRISLQEHPELPNLLLDPYLGQEVIARQSDLRNVVRTAIELGIPVPGLMATLAYYDCYRSAWLPVNLIQAQRNFFGAQELERIDASPSVKNSKPR